MPRSNQKKKSKDRVVTKFDKYFKYFRAVEEMIKEWQGYEAQAVEGIEFIVNTAERIPLIKISSLGVLCEFNNIEGMMLQNHYDSIESILKSLRDIL